MGLPPNDVLPTLLLAALVENRLTLLLGTLSANRRKERNAMGSSTAQGELWGATAQDWADENRFRFIIATV